MAKTHWTKLALLSIKANRVPLILGGPGIGKTDMLENEVHRRYWGGDDSAPFVAVSPALSDPTDATGPLAVVADKAVRLLPDVMKPLFEQKCGTFFIDELTTATAATQAAFLRTVQNRVVGDTPMPEDVRIVMAANPSDIAAGGSEIVTPLANRVVHITAGPPEARDWSNWLCARQIDSAGQRRSAALIAGFITANTQRLYALPEDESKRAMAWPSPRSWHSAADCFAAAIDSGEEAVALELVAGCVGAGVAQEFATYIANADLPDPRDVLTGKIPWAPERHRVDRASVVLRAVASEAAHGPARDAQERAALVEKAWEIASAACDVGLTDCAYGAAVPLQNWRLTKSGAPRALGAAEAKVGPRFFDVLKATR